MYMGSLFDPSTLWHLSSYIQSLFDINGVIQNLCVLIFAIPQNKTENLRMCFFIKKITNAVYCYHK